MPANAVADIGASGQFAIPASWAALFLVPLTR
jgi:hypothetical protein